MDSLEPQQQQALVLLASGKGVDEISEILNIHRLKSEGEPHGTHEKS